MIESPGYSPSSRNGAISKFKSVKAHEKMSPPRLDPSKELVLTIERGSSMMENKFSEKFNVKKQADISNLDYKYPH